MAAAALVLALGGTSAQLESLGCDSTVTVAGDDSEQVGACTHDHAHTQPALDRLYPHHGPRIPTLAIRTSSLGGVECVVVVLAT